jgi:ankyrin repeat protein
VLTSCDWEFDDREGADFVDALLDTVFAITRGGADINAAGEGGALSFRRRVSYTLLHLAALFDRAAIVSRLVAAGADATARDYLGFPPLAYAALCGGEDALAALLRAGAAPGGSPLSATPLALAAASGRLNIVRALLAAGATPAPPALHFCALHGALDVLAALLDAGADVNACDTHGRTPLYWAAFSSHFSDVARDAARRDGVVAALLARGASVGCADALRRTPLHIAAGGKDGGAVHALAVAPGADVDALDAVGLSPLACAAGAGNRAAVALLLTCGADARGGAHVGGVQPAHAARAQGHRELAALLDRAAARAGRPTAAKAGATIWRHLAYTRASRSLDVGLFLLMIDVDEFRQEAAEERKQRLAFFIMSSAVKALAPPPTRHAPWWQLWRPRGARVEPA